MWCTWLDISGTLSYAKPHLRLLALLRRGRAQMVFVREQWPEANGATVLQQTASLLLPDVSADFPYGVWEQRAPHLGKHSTRWRTLCGSDSTLNVMLANVVRPPFDIKRDVAVCEVTPWLADADMVSSAPHSTSRRIGMLQVPRCSQARRFPEVIQQDTPLTYVYIQLVSLHVSAGGAETDRQTTLLSYLRAYRLPNDEGGFYPRPFGGGTPWNAKGVFFWDGYATFRTENEVSARAVRVALSAATPSPTRYVLSQERGENTNGLFDTLCFGDLLDDPDTAHGILDAGCGDDYESLSKLVRWLHREVPRPCCHVAVSDLVGGSHNFASKASEYLLKVHCRSQTLPLPSNP